MNHPLDSLNPGRGQAGNSARVRRPVPVCVVRTAFRGERRRALMSVCTRRALRLSLAAFLLISSGISPAFAAEVHGRITDPLGVPVAGAELALLAGGKIVTSGRSATDGTYSLRTGQSGHFYVVVVSQTFRQISTPAFYAGVLDSHLQNVVLEPERIHQQVVVTAT